MGERRFVVFLDDGTVRTIVAETVSHKDSQDPICFLNATGEVVASFSRKSLIAWREEHQPEDTLR